MYVYFFPCGVGGKEPAYQCRRLKRCIYSWIGKIPWRRAWQPTPAFLPGESHGQRSPAGYRQGLQRVGHEWSDLAHTHTHTHVHIYEAKSLSCVQPFVTPWTVAYQVPSMRFSRQEYWSGLPFPSAEDLPDPGTQVSHIAGRCFTVWATREACTYIYTRTYNWVTVLYTWNQHNTVNQLDFRFKKLYTNMTSWVCTIMRWEKHIFMLSFEISDFHMFLH